MDGLRRAPEAALVDPAAVTVEGDLARIDLGDWSLQSYRRFVQIKGRLSTYDVRDAFRRGGLRDHGPVRPQLVSPVGDLAALGVAPPRPAGSQDPAHPAMFEDQRWVLELALRRKRFALFAEAGWGKTLTLLAFARAAVALAGKPVLVVVPLAVYGQTFEEWAHWWPGEALPRNLRAESLDVRAWVAEGRPEVGVVNVDAFRAEGPALDGLGGFVLDESSILKNMAGRIRTAITKAVRPVEYRLACSATPAPNDLEEYVSHALFVGAVKDHKEFFADFFDADGAGGWHLRKHAREAFYRFMASWSVWMRRPERYGFPARLGGIPAPIFADVDVEPTPEQQAEAKAFRRGGSLFLESTGVVERSKLAQISRGFLYERRGGKTVARPIPSRKPDAVAACVARHPEARAIVWVAFDEEARIVAEALARVGRRSFAIDGSTSDGARAAAVRAINAHDPAGPDVLVAKAATMGFGVNLQGASVVVFSGVGDSFEQDYQSLRRAFRYGQTRTVHCYYVVTPFERAMLDNVRQKRAAWAEQTDAMEEAFVAAQSHELARHRGELRVDEDRTAFALSAADLAALAALARLQPAPGDRHRV